MFAMFQSGKLHRARYSGCTESFDIVPARPQRAGKDALPGQAGATLQTDLQPQGETQLFCLDDADGLIELEGQNRLRRHFDRAALG